MEESTTVVNMAGDDERLCDVRLYNIIVVGLGFMFLFTAFQAGSMAEVCLSVYNYVF